ncbi:AAA family ATPase [Salirhabdus sp. Marseille-P4669]|uniref:AAA family ATPase n=1 Tax=Salirhabdus sp. Marseille-P4669 TaxID=2042310 RepID=UPI001F2A76EA|nr:AAA family ATPase [Salirhabdus sp. Marseille-P4669]
MFPIIILINGAFGVGKTTTAKKLNQLIPNSIIFDPENIGYLLRELVPENMRQEHERTGDFQDFDLWKILTVQVATMIKNKYNKTLIVPMTIYKKENFTYIFNQLKDLDKDTYHFCLTANEKTIHARLLKRGEDEGNWSFQQTNKCVEAFQEDLFEEKIITDTISSDEVVQIISSRVKENIGV